MKAYKKLEKIYKKIDHLSHMQAIVYWDWQTMMPSGSNEVRSNAMAEFGTLLHKISTDKKIAKLIKKASKEKLKKTQKASLKEIKRVYTQSTILPSSLVKKQSLAHSKCSHNWVEQRKNNDWEAFSKNLKEVVALSRQEAKIRAKNSNLSAYDSLLDLFEPGMRTKTLDKIFLDVKKWLPKLIQKVLKKQKEEKIIEINGTFHIQKQKELGIKVMKYLGFDFDKGRTDISAHPFCGGVAQDVRITTRYNENDFIQALMGTIHETGHACYEQGLAAELVQLPVGKARSMGIHESQSLFFEMQIGRSKEFLQSIHPYITQAFGENKAFEIKNLTKIYTKVKPSYIRVDADEVTYAAHVILRYEIERDLINGLIEVEDIPRIWDEKMKEYLNVDTKGNFKDGCMQDVHWTEGLFGYFPSYTLGAMYAAQEFASVKKAYPDIEKSVKNGDLSQIKNWLEENIWSKASTLETSKLIKKATKENLNPKYFKKHLENRYLNS